MTNFDQKSDSELLRRFCEEGAAAAFDALVQRYAGMVCGVANRVTGRRELAEEAAQNVFAQLAHKARSLVGRGGRLAGWLHRAAVFEAKHLLRGERRHERRVEMAGREQVERSTADGDDPLRAEIDSALNSLSASDREVIVWHYYTGLSYREIAERSGKSEAAAQKQGRRALEKLGAQLRWAGVTASVAGLASFFGAGMSEAVPTGVVAGWGAAAMTAKAGSAAALPAAGLGKVAIGVAAAVALLVTIVYQGQLLAKERKQSAAVTPSKIGGKVSPVSALNRPDFQSDPSYGGAEDVDLERLANDLYRGVMQFDRDRSLRAIADLESIGRLHRDALCELFERGEEMRLSPGRRTLLLARLAPLVAAHDPAWLMHYCFPAEGEGRSQVWLDRDGLSHGVMAGVAEEWGKRDPEGALDWLALALGERRFGETAGTRNSSPLTQFTKSIAAANWPERQALVEEIAIGLPSSGGAEVMRGMTDLIQEETGLLALANSPMLQSFRDREMGTLSKIGRRLSNKKWGEVSSFLEQIADPFARREVLVGASQGHFEASPAGGEIDTAVDKFLRWAREQNLPDQDSGYAIGALLGHRDAIREGGLMENAKRVASELGFGETVIGSYLAHRVGPGHPMHLLAQAVKELEDPAALADVGYRAVVYMQTGANRDKVLEGVGFGERAIELVNRRFAE